MIHNPAQTQILIVDDNPTNCELLHRRLTRQGYNCDVARSGIEMLRQVEAHTPDLILLDYMMPEMDGIQVLRILRETHASTTLPVLMVTARNAREDVVTAFEAGANDYVEKPVDFPVLLARLRHHLEHKRLQDEVIRSRVQLQESNRRWRSAHDQRGALLSFVTRELHPPAQVLRAIADDPTRLVPPMATDNAPKANDGLASMGSAIQTSARHLIRLLEDLQDLAGLDTGQIQLEPSPTDTFVLTTNTLHPLRKLANERSIQLTETIQPKLDVAVHDPKRLQQIIRNLVGIGLDYTKPGGSLAFNAALIDERQLQLRMDGAIEFRLEQEQFLSPPMQGFMDSSRRATTGLAFSLLRKLADLHRGRLELNIDQPDHCASITIILPYRAIGTL